MNKGADRQALLKDAIPVIAGVLFVLLFARLGIWQLDRAAQKIALEQAFEHSASYSQVSEILEPALYQALETRGRYLDDSQVLLDKVILDGRVGYYVVSPIEYTPNGPLLLVNRGFVPKNELPDITLGDQMTTVRGKAGGLPKVGIRPGEAFAEPQGRPLVAVWPTTDEISARLGRELLPYVLLLDPGENNGFVRRWKPRQAGPSTHYGYAFQWFAMAVAAMILLGWHVTRRWRKRAR